MIRSKALSSTVPGKHSLRLLKWGSGGDPLLLLHGLGGNSHWWDEAAPQLAHQFKVVALDFRGHGDSGWAENGRYDLNGFLEDIDSARKYLGWQQMHLAAHSMGARVAVSYAHKWPARIRRLVAIDFLPRLGRARLQKFSVISRMKQPVYPSVKAIIRRFRLEPRATALDRRSLERLARYCIRKAEGGYTWKFDWRAFHFHYGSIQSTLNALRTESLIIRGAKSDLMRPKVYREVVRAIPGARGVEIPGAYHHVPLDAPYELADRMTEFLIGKCGAD